MIYLVNFGIVVATSDIQFRKHARSAVLSLSIQPFWCHFRAHQEKNT